MAPTWNFSSTLGSYYMQKYSMKSVVGVTGFEPATPTSRMLGEGPDHDSILGLAGCLMPGWLNML